MQICKYCHESSVVKWHSRNVCEFCYKERCRMQWTASVQRRKEQAALDDPLILPARVHVDGMSCAWCSHTMQCRELVQRGAQVLCAPVHESDLLIERAYQARLEMSYEYL